MSTHVRSSINQTMDAWVSISDRDALDYIRQWMQGSIYQIASAGDYIRQRVQEYLTDIECRRYYIRQ